MRSSLLGSHRSPAGAFTGAAAVSVAPREPRGPSAHAASVAAAAATSGKLATLEDLKGKVCPWSGLMPVYLLITGTAELHLPCFSTPTALRDALVRARAPYSSIQRIDHPRAFLDPLPRVISGRQVKVILDLAWLDPGRVDYTEVRCA